MVQRGPTKHSNWMKSIDVHWEGGKLLVKTEAMDDDIVCDWQGGFMTQTG